MTFTLPAYTPTNWELTLPGYPVITASFRSTSYPDILGSLPSESRWKLSYENMTGDEALALLLPWKATGCGIWPLGQLPAEVAGGVDDANFRKRLIDVAWAIEREPVMLSVKNGRFTVTIDLIHELTFQSAPAFENPIQSDPPVFGLNEAPVPEQSELRVNDGPYVIGYHFATDFARRLTRIGIYKPVQSGVNQPSTMDHSVGIWDWSNVGAPNYGAPTLIWQQDFLASSTCVADSTPTVTPYYCWFDITGGPELDANVDYVIAATWDERSPVEYPREDVNIFLQGFRLNETAATQQGAVPDMLIDLDSESYYAPTINTAPQKGFLTVNMALSSIT